MKCKCLSCDVSDDYLGEIHLRYDRELYCSIADIRCYHCGGTLVPMLESQICRNSSEFSDMDDSRKKACLIERANKEFNKRGKEEKEFRKIN